MLLAIKITNIGFKNLQGLNYNVNYNVYPLRQFFQ